MGTLRGLRVKGLKGERVKSSVRFGRYVYVFVSCYCCSRKVKGQRSKIKGIEAQNQC